MKRLKLDEVRRMLPALDELRPVFDLLLQGSAPDPEHSWSGAGELATEAGRLVDSGAVTSQADDLADRVRLHLVEVYRVIGEAIERLGTGDRAGAARSLLEAAALEESHGRPERALAYARAAHGAAPDSRKGGPASRALRRWARAAKALGDLLEARSRYEEAFEIARATGDATGAAEAAIGLGNVLEQQGLWEEARTWYEEALRALEAIPGPVTERWQAKVNIHIALRSAGDLEQSLPWLVEAEEEAAALGDESAAPFLENAHGQLRLWSGDFEAAELRFRSALEATDHPAPRVTIRLNLAESLLAQGRRLDASEEARAAEREALRGAVIPKLPEIYRLLGRISSAEGNPDAFVLFERSLEICSERALPVLEQALTLQAYSAAERRRGEDETATALLEKARDLYRTVGIERVRHQWVDVYSAAAESSGNGEDPVIENDEPKGVEP